MLTNDYDILICLPAWIIHDELISAKYLLPDFDLLLLKVLCFHDRLNDGGEDVTSDTEVHRPVALKFNTCTEIEAGMARGAEYLDW